MDESSLYIVFIELKGNRAFFISHELKKMYFIELDAYDLLNSKIEQTYKLEYIPPGWGRHKIHHNGKTYKLYEI